MSAATRILILGGGPAGLGAALGLARRGFAPTVVEAQDAVGGNAGSFTLHGLRVDYGSHRLHPATHPAILSELRGLLGKDLVERPRHGRIRLGDRWIHFPLRAADLALHAPPAFVLGVGRDAAARLMRNPPGGPGGSGEVGASGGAPGASGGETFASVLLRGLGATVCRDFYLPYARKIWGLEPEEISPVQASKRVSAASFGAMLGRLLPGGEGGGGRSGRGTFWYPRNGYGQISEALRDAAAAAGAEILTGTRVVAVRLRTDGGAASHASPGWPDGGDGPRLAVEVEHGPGRRLLACDHAWSTIPLGVLVRVTDPSAPPEVLAAVGRLEQRAMLLVYLVLEQDRFTEYDAHYFPGAVVPFTRVSEPKNYSGCPDPAGSTVLCAEFPCSTRDPIWTAPEAELGDTVREGLARVGLPVRARVLEVAARRLPSAYPIYRVGYEEHFAKVDAWVASLKGVLTFGRQGLYAHDNTHHALVMARAAVECLGEDGRFDAARWAEHRRAFEEHVVED